MPQCVENKLSQGKIAHVAKQFGSKCIGEMKVKIIKQDYSIKEITIVSISGVPRTTVEEASYVTNFKMFCQEVCGINRTETGIK